MKNLSFTLTLLLAFTFSNHVYSQSQTRLENVLEIIQEIKNLADEFDLTNEQKTQVRSVLMNYLPNIAIDTSAMLNNRKRLLESHLNHSTNNNLEEYMLDIANQQGQLLTNIIISKEHMKNEIKVILTEDQQNFVEDLITTIIQFRMNHS